MKNLKIKFGLFSLLAVLAVSVFLTSCEQENLVNQEVPGETTHNSQNLEEGIQFWMPKGIDESPEKASNYLNEISENEFEILKENYRISEFLRSIGKFEGIYDLVPQESLFTDLQLENLLNETEYLALQKYQIEDVVESRGCFFLHCPEQDYCWDASPFPCGNVQADIQIYNKYKICWDREPEFYGYSASCYKPCAWGVISCY